MSITRPTRSAGPPRAHPAVVATPVDPALELDHAAWRWALRITLVLTLIRLFVLRASPLQLYPDEAQYWVWSRHLAFGYFSKPPMIAWIIWLTTHVTGDAEPFVRVSSPLLHAAAGLFVYAAGRKLYDPRTGVLGLVLYQLCGAVQIGAFVVSTDTPLCAFLAAALWAYAVLQDAEGRRRLVAASGFGLALGLAFLAKYAALYALIGVAIHLATSPAARRAWSWRTAALAAGTAVVVAAPNLAWNASHGFVTVANVADQAAWDSQHKHFDLIGLASFLGAQFGVFGPGPFAVLVGGLAMLVWRRRLAGPDLLLAAWTLPPLALIAVEAFISRANANWAVVAYIPASALVAAWLVRARAWRWTTAIVATQAIIAAAIMAGLAVPSLADKVGASNALKPLRGWREQAGLLQQRAELEQLAAPLTAVVVDDRYLYNEAAYYGRDYFDREGPPLKVWLAGPAPTNEAERAAPLTAAVGQRVLVAGHGDGDDAAMMKTFAKSGDLEINSIGLDAKHSVRLDTFVAEGFKGGPEGR